MRSLVKLLIVIILLGTAIQQGWLQAGSHQAAELLGAPPGLGPVPDREAAFQSSFAALGAVLGGVAGTVRQLPDPWYGLALTVCGLIAVTLLVSAVGTLVRAVTRFGGWLRDISV